MRGWDVRGLGAGRTWSANATNARAGFYGVGMDISRLRDRLIEIDYTTDSVLERIGNVGQAGLHRNCTLPADVALAGADDPLATLIRMFLLRQQVTY